MCLRYLYKHLFSFHLCVFVGMRMVVHAEEHLKSSETGVTAGFEMPVWLLGPKLGHSLRPSALKQSNFFTAFSFFDWFTSIA